MKCEACNGKGHIEIVKNADLTNRESSIEECDNCCGEGELCSACGEPYEECWCDEDDHDDWSDYDDEDDSEEDEYW